MKTVLVTGSSGFIASHTIDLLQKEGYKVIGLQRHCIPNNEINPDCIYFGDIRDKNFVDKVVSMSDYVINLAGILGTQETINNPYPSVETNIIGALNILESCRIWNKPLVQISVGNYWMNNSYSISKSCAERLTLMYVKEHKLRANVVRALNAFGERQKYKPVRKMMAYFIHQALENEDIGIYGDGLQVMDFVYVKDVSNIILDVLFSARNGSVVEAGTGKGKSVLWWANKIIELSSSSSKIIHLPMRPGEPIGSQVIAKDPYPYDYTDIELALKNTIRWYEQQKSKSVKT